MPGFLSQKYSRHGLWSLFLICAFPLHMWTLIMAFRDISWLTERTNLWDAIGVASYGMVIALVESVMVFLLVAVIGFFTPSRWSSDQRTAFLSLLFLITALWAIVIQLLSLWNVFLPAAVVQFLRESAHPLRILYAASLAVVAATIFLPVYSFMRSKQAVPFMQGLMERFSTLAVFYLVFDLIGLIIIVLRNIN
jgi:hypothetical protein